MSNLCNGVNELEFRNRSLLDELQLSCEVGNEEDDVFFQPSDSDDDASAQSSLSSQSNPKHISFFDFPQERVPSQTKYAFPGQIQLGICDDENDLISRTKGPERVIPEKQKYGGIAKQNIGTKPKIQDGNSIKGKRKRRSFFQSLASNLRS